MNESERRELVAQYLRYKATLDLEPTGRTPADEAYSTVTRLIDEDPPDIAWSIVLDILRSVPDNELGDFAAGPLEDVVRQHGAALIDRIESEARSSERFREALECIWLSRDELPPRVLERVVSASGGEIKPLRGAR